VAACHLIHVNHASDDKRQAILAICHLIQAQRRTFGRLARRRLRTGTAPDVGPARPPPVANRRLQLAVNPWLTAVTLGLEADTGQLIN
jgi:hypothetical protein